MAEHYVIGYVPPLEFNSNPYLGLKEQTIMDAKVIGAGAREVFERRFGKDYLSNLMGISKSTLVMLLEYGDNQKAILFPESEVGVIKLDAEVKWIRDLEGKNLDVISQYGRPVGIKI